MPSLFWSGRLSLPMKILVEANNVLALVTGSYKDLSGMKLRVRKGYEGEFTGHVYQYDELGFHLQYRSACIQLEGISLAGMNVLDVGCGTGVLTKVAFENGAQSVVCGDISSFMLNMAKVKEDTRILNLSFCQLDAESLPFEDNSFDAVISGMTFGTLPDQKLVTNEMIRITKPGGLMCIGAHGPSHYWESIDATLRCINKRYVIGYRFEWCPRTEHYLRALLENSNLNNIRSKQVIWQNEFEDGSAAYDFFAAISSSWWYAKFPPEERKKDSVRTRKYFKNKNIRIITDDIVVAHGCKP
jgi:ubiquinone/menaquinone biosynthesis C-methylase UbiE